MTSHLNENSLQSPAPEASPQPVSLLQQYPVPDLSAVLSLLQEEIAADPSKIIVLDDDPTGTQTVHDVSVYTDWTYESIRSGFAEPQKLFYVLTNSRAMTAEETAKVHREIGAVAARVSAETGIPYFFMSRSDSTLRGHFPLETRILQESMEKNGCPADAEVLCPFFPEGGRYTVGNIHYVKQGDVLVPAAQTEFAKDVTFGYSHSSMPEYIEEKTGGECKAEDVVSISLEELRSLDVNGICRRLLSVRNFGKVCVNAADYCDIRVFAAALYKAMAQGHRFMFRTAAGLVKILGGVSDKPLLTREEMVSEETGTGGVVVVGSHMKKTTDQLRELLTLTDRVVPISFDSDKVLEGDEAFDAEVARCVAEEEAAIRSGKTAVCFTKRKLLVLENDTKESALLRSVKISDGVRRLVGQLGVKPAFVVAKGGITSSDVATKALGIRRADVLGQICPGIPVWRCGPEGRFPGVPLVVFPGNVGDAETLKEAVRILTTS